MACHADELRELLTVLDSSERPYPGVIATETSFAGFEQQHFHVSELRGGDRNGCRAQKNMIPRGFT
jgi:hypothetical protein